MKTEVKFMLEFLKFFAVAFGVFLVIDLVWLGVVARKFYKQQLGYLMAEKVNWVAAIIFYVIYIAGLTYFVLLNANTWTDALLNGALLGFLGYATYDLTNLSTLKGWPLKITLVDLVWGTTLGALVSVITFLLVG